MIRKLLSWWLDRLSDASMVIFPPRLPYHLCLTCHRAIFEGRDPFYYCPPCTVFGCVCDHLPRFYCEECPPFAMPDTDWRKS